MPRHTLTPALRRTLIVLMLAALLVSQALGLLHRSWHAPHAFDTFATVTAGDAAFSHSAGDAGCKLYDQLSHADLAVFVPASLLHARPAEKAAAAEPCVQLAAQAAGFLARGPPKRV